MPKPTLTGAVSARNYSISVLDAAGQVARVGVTGFTAGTTDANLAALRDAIGDLSNARITNTNTTADLQFVNGADDGPLDEAYGAAQTKAIFVFQSVGKPDKRIELPCPDASIFGSDGVTVDLTNTQVMALVTAFRVVFGADYDPVRAFLSSRTRKTPGGRLKPVISEPGATVEPPDAPAIGGE